MKFELKTENYSNSFTNVLRYVLIIALIIIFCDAALKLGIIARHYQIEHKCRLLSLEKSKSNFRKLSNLTNLRSKQRIWEFCREVVK
ncbi:hypothetical protein [Prochlorococcus marinus]|uniref:hypothetical protein n=1 Tax=Prochlorococcus marinus TaxID=1219 RepID=UPI001ADA14ED|nr:hypothetical protein [Prochlorococcus marinus]MBO8204593.1 hypothetical protein [Prochlorococcus marinus CUG1415]MBW3043881.1 hypothetical protein [Prochlorococcus marinus str. MU1415]